MKLAKERNLSNKNIRRIESLQEHLDEVLKEPYLFVPTPDKVPEYIEAIEFYMQELWEFPQDRDFHSHWYRVKWCTCPKLDNDDNIGEVGRYISSSCPYHGSQATTWDDERFGEEE